MLKTAVVESSGFQFEYFINDNLAKNSIGLNKPWESHITNFVKAYGQFKAQGIQNIIDVGANFGYHTLLFSREARGIVFGFEPQIQNYELLKINSQRNQIENVYTSNLACGDVECEVRLPIIEDSVNPVNMGDFTPDTGFTQNFSATKSIPLDKIQFPFLPGLDKIDLIKIDVQGWEKRVLMGAENLLKTHKPVLIVEFEHFQLRKTNTTCEELFTYIRSLGYHIFYLEYEYPSDHVCVHNDNLLEFRTGFQDRIMSHKQYNDINQNIYHWVNERIVM